MGGMMGGDSGGSSPNYVPTSLGAPVYGQSGYPSAIPAYQPTVPYQPDPMNSLWSGIGKAGQQFGEGVAGGGSPVPQFQTPSMTPYSPGQGGSGASLIPQNTELLDAIQRLLQSGTL